ncbi:MAG TPA: PD-(D/E)XK nuclease family protein [Verrucomicrobiae bacterium]|nr:PD-(D/E)XK nuclease family protein [Verrucomicrobiae bacterium]
MQIRFLLGPAGTGKTFRCLAEIREVLHQNPAGPALILLAPKQATFQLERQLLADPHLPGFTRLHILSFERLARFVFQQLDQPEPELLAEEGRVMVLRALLEQHRDQLHVFRATARLPGFARQLSQLLRELHRSHLSSARLDELASRLADRERLPAKLQDIAIISRAYSEWLKAHQLEDADTLLDLATAALRNAQGTAKAFRLEALWLDGFAQMTPQEHALLTALIMSSQRATLAFCLDAEPSETPPWHSPWAEVAQTFLRCRDALRSLPQAHVTVEVLRRDSSRSRFIGGSALEHMEKHCGFARQNACPPDGDRSIRIIACSQPEAEAEWIARQIRHHARAGGRYRDVAVVLRSLESHSDVFRTVFARYEIPFFLDRREPVAHHPLAELTRHALRIAAYGWEHDDWFAALKTGLVSRDQGGMDWLENEALARGWHGAAFWSQPIQLDAPEGIVQRLELLRQHITPPFVQFIAHLNSSDQRISGMQLASALQSLWSALRVDRQLQEWSDAAEAGGRLPNPALHKTVWDQMLAWLDNIQLAFGDDAFRATEWLPIVEAGLGNLTVGAVPPALDQVLVGAVDRSRNPELQMVFVPGMNEGIFPAPPPAPNLLSHSERDTLAEHHASLGPGLLHQLGLERYYAYVACTRAREQLVITYAERDGRGRELNPSVIVTDLQRQLPSIAFESFAGVTQLLDTVGNTEEPPLEHWTEAVVHLLRNPWAGATAGPGGINAAMDAAIAKWNALSRAAAEHQLAPDLVSRIHGAELRTSVSALEDFAACPFRFFVGHGLRAGERLEFEIDAREKGSFQHEILQEFHHRVARSGRRWRDVPPSEARAMVREIGDQLVGSFKDGLFTAAQTRRFTARMLIEGLERLVETLVTWNAQYQFDPAMVEAGFGLKESELPGWRIDLDDQHALILRGRIDRIDLCPIPETGATLAVVIDYKSSQRELDSVLLDHGLQLQLLAYLGALEQFRNLDSLNAPRLIPAGAFYVALNGGIQSAKNRNEERAQRDQARQAASQHRGRFDGGYLAHFDASGRNRGEQFRFSRKRNGEFARTANEALSSAEFQALVRKVEDFLRRHGQEIYSGHAAISPFRYRGQIACTYCDYQPVCRFDPWTQPFRVLRPVAS